MLPSVVKIDVTGNGEAGSGSGIILTADGTILTNNHVVEVAGEGGTIKVDFSDGTSADAEILGTDPLTDTAVIQAQDVSGLTPATIGKSANLGVGEGVVAVGSPFGLDATVTSGIVSALDRPVNVGSDDEGNSTTYPAIQTDAAINPGNSGGPLTDMTGAVVGINSSIRTASSQTSEQSGSIGLGFAIPIDEVMPIVDQMAKGETPTHARLGLQVGNPQTGDDAGAVVREVSVRVDRERGRPRRRRRHHQGRRPADHRRRLARRHDPLLPPRRLRHRDVDEQRRRRRPATSCSTATPRRADRRHLVAPAWAGRAMMGRPALLRPPATTRGVTCSSS